MPENTRFISSLPVERAAYGAAFISVSGDHAACHRQRQAAAKPRDSSVFRQAECAVLCDNNTMLSCASSLKLRHKGCAAVALCGLLLTAAAEPAVAADCLLEPQGDGHVAEVVDARTLRLEDGREVILAGIEPVTPGATDNDKTRATKARRGTVGDRCRP
jgi:hypothetical protein